jgi:hypothetical protein
MADPVDHLQAVGEIVRGLGALGLDPVLVGGMALVVLGLEESRVISIS